jgi:hypothetical protein
LASDVWFYRWPVQLLYPFSSRGWEVGLLTWNDLVPTLLLYAGVAVAIGWPAVSAPTAAASIAALGLYLLWRAWQPRPVGTWDAWLAGGWARQTSRIWRWLTGDFIT